MQQVDSGVENNLIAQGSSQCKHPSCVYKAKNYSEGEIIYYSGHTHIGRGQSRQSKAVHMRGEWAYAYTEYKPVYSYRTRQWVKQSQMDIYREQKPLNYNIENRYNRQQLYMTVVKLI